MELRQLQYFLVVAEELNFSRDADRLNMTQPPLSAQIRQLEDELAVTLFERSTRKVTLTAAGEAFQRSTKRLVNQLDSNVIEAQRIAKGEIGQLTLGFVPSAMAEILPPILREFRTRFPDVRLVLHELTPEQQVRGLRDGSLDCACFYLPFNGMHPFGDRSLESAPISREPLVSALPVDHHLTAQRKIAIESLADEPFVTVAGHSGQGLREIILEHCRRGDFKPHIVQEAALIGTIAGLVASGVGVALLPASVRRMQKIGISYRPLQDNPIHVKMGLIWVKERSHPTLEGFVNVAEEIHGKSTRNGTP